MRLTVSGRGDAAGLSGVTEVDHVTLDESVEPWQAVLVMRRTAAGWQRAVARACWDLHDAVGHVRVHRIERMP